MVVIAFTACNENCIELAGKSLVFNVYTKGYSSSISEYSQYNLNKKVDSLDALINLSNENNYPFFNENDENYNSDLSQKVREYDASYFQEKVLILVFYFKSAGYPIKIDSLRIQNDTIKVIMAMPKLSSVDDVVSWQAFLIELDKKDVEGIDKVETVQIIKGKMKDYDYY
jgi:hypothetical protein